MRRAKKPLDPIPYDNDWYDPEFVWNIDTPGAYEIFSGKSIDQAIPLIAQDSLHHNEDLCAMPPRCLMALTITVI